ncbi:nuclear transport factor 2 family protein [Dyadobacter luticola]|uniref:Isopropylmalate/homocitrate/citramalate synthase n=1 Tax=Dyadobacter luticola TaxID=1979387 RepID=A0A5R9KPX3_9BACT|nr:nuclear transport factor 2 family protein [Dyadobacter luticola]TLU98230.1 isopropylmalate/homocitrate/citramalate synthase [Dyadobacter luticola]
MTALETVRLYYQCFNQRNWKGMLTLLDPEVRHEANQGDVRIGADKFTEFLQKMDESYEEHLTDMVLFSEPSGKRVAAEFVVNGVYKKGEPGMPEAHGQPYVLPAGAFLEVKEGRISRVTTYYNLPLWIDLVSKTK